MRSQLVGAALRTVRSAGGDVTALCRRFALPESAESDPDALLALENVGAFFEAAAEAAREPSLGLRLAAAVQTGTFGVAEYACRTSSNVGEALRRLTRYIALLNEVVRIDISRASDASVIIEQRVPGRPLVLGRHANEFFVAFLVLSVQRLTGAPCRPKRVWIAHSVPSDRKQLAAIFGACELRVGAEANGVALDAKTLEAPLLSADPNLHRIMESQAERALRERGQTSNERAFIRQAIRELLDGGTPSLSATARRLGMSARTLQRRLLADDTSFQAEIDSVRSHLAEVYMEDPRLSLAEIAFLLGYTDQSTFGRAYRRWTGKSPTEARRDAIGRT